MEARCQRSIVSMAVAFVAYSFGATITPSTCEAAGYRTTNFVVSAPTPALAKEIGDTAEVWRTKLSAEWLGEPMPPCHHEPLQHHVPPAGGPEGPRP